MLKNEQVREYLLAQAASLNGGEKLPSRLQLCRKFGFSRMTVDAAIKALVEEGVLLARVGSGTFVNPGWRSGMNHLEEGAPSWGVILPDLVDDVFPQFIRGIEDYSQGRGINVVICNTDVDVEKENLYLERMAEMGAQGVILFPDIATASCARGIEALQARGIPVVLCNRVSDAFPGAQVVCSNDFYGAYIAVKHMIARGYRNIAYLSLRRYRTSLDRYLGYASAILESGLTIDQSRVLLEPEHSDGVLAAPLIDAVTALLDAKDPPDAFFCFNDRAALCVYRAAKRLGRAISSELGVMGYDDSNICEALDPPLTSVRFGGYKMGAMAAKLLEREIHGRGLEGNRVYVLQPELAVRQSCLGRGRA